MLTPRHGRNFMKCQLQANQKSNSMRNVFFAALLLSLMGVAVNSFAHCSIDAIKQEIVKTLQHTNRPAITRYNDYDKGICKLLNDFLNVNNRESCTAHIAKFEAAMIQFKQEIVDHPEFDHAHLRPMLDKLYQDLGALLNILRRYSNQKGMSAVTNFILELLQFEHLLPNDIKQKYPKLTLLKSINHRLNSNKA